MIETSKRFLFSALLVVSVSACATKPLPTDGTAVVGPDEGLMAVRFVSNWKGNDSIVFEELAFGVRLDGTKVNEVLEMRSNDDAQLVALPVGQYEWMQATIGTNYVAFDSQSKFSIRPGQITYVGDITLDVRSEPFLLITEEFKVENNRDKTIARLRTDYGAFMDRFAINVEIAEMTLENR